MQHPNVAIQHISVDLPVAVRELSERERNSELAACLSVRLAMLQQGYVVSFYLCYNHANVGFPNNAIGHRKILNCIGYQREYFATINSAR